MSNVPRSSTKESETTLFSGVPESSSSTNNTSASGMGPFDVPPPPYTMSIGNPTLLVDRLRIGLHNSTNTDPRYARPSDPRLDGCRLFGPGVDWVPRYVVNALLAMYKSGVTDPNFIFPRLQGPPLPLPQLSFPSVCHAVKIVDAIYSGNSAPAIEAPKRIKQIGAFSSGWIDKPGFKVTDALMEVIEMLFFDIGIKTTSSIYASLKSTDYGLPERPSSEIMDELINRIVDPADLSKGGQKAKTLPDWKERKALKDLGLYKLW